MEELKLVLTKTKEYNLIPFGKFKFKWCPSKKVNKKLNIISMSEINSNFGTGMPYSVEDEKKFCKYMLKHKTDVLTNSNQNVFYTRLGDSWVEIEHFKLKKYKAFIIKHSLTDNDESFKYYIDCHYNVDIFITL